MPRINLTSDKMQRLAKALAVAGNTASIFMDAKERKDRAHLQELMFELDMQDKSDAKREREQERSIRRDETLYQRGQDVDAAERYEQEWEHGIEREKEGDLRTRLDRGTAQRLATRDRAAKLKQTRYANAITNLDVFNNMAGAGARGVQIQKEQFESLLVDEYGGWYKPSMEKYFPDQEPRMVAAALATAFSKGSVKDGDELLERLGMDLTGAQRSGLELILDVSVVGPGNALAETVATERKLREQFVNAGINFYQEYGPAETHPAETHPTEPPPPPPPPDTDPFAELVRGAKEQKTAQTQVKASSRESQIHGYIEDYMGFKAGQQGGTIPEKGFWGQRARFKPNPEVIASDDEWRQAFEVMGFNDELRDMFMSGTQINRQRAATGKSARGFSRW